MTDTICFPPHEGLPFTYSPPTIDGFVEPDFSVISDDASNETGWTRATRIANGNDTTLPNMEFQCVHNNSQDLMYMSFILRFDQSFDDLNTIIIVLQPNYAAAAVPPNPVLTSDARRIDITPVYGGVGAGLGADDHPSDPQHVRSNRVPQEVTFKMYNTTTNVWDQIASSAISNWDIKVRSWQIGNNDFDWSVEVQLPTKPAGPQGGGTNWIDLTGASFGLYVNVLQVCGTCQTFPVENYFSTQYTWPAPDYNQTPPSRIIQNPLPGGDLHEAVIPFGWLGIASLAASPGTCQGVRFENGPLGIGIKDPANPTNPLGITVNTIVNATNTFAARLLNDRAGTANDVSATFRIAEWGVGPGNQTEWPLLPHTSTTGPIFDPTQPLPVPTGPAYTEFTVTWTFDSSDRTTFQGNSDRCLWVTLDSGQNVTFAEDSVRRNLNFINLSSSEKEATISGKGHAKSSDGSNNHDFLLYVSKRPIISTQYTEESVRGSGPPFGVPYQMAPRRATGGQDEQKLKQELPPLITALFENWAGNQKTINSLLWIVNAYRRSGYTLTLGGKKFDIFEHVGGFGHVGDHLGEITGFSDSLSGQGLIRLAEGVYRLPVPVDGAVTIQTRLETIEALNSGFMVQGTYGTRGNFELVVPHESGGLAHCARDNDDPSTFPWRGPTVFGADLGHVDAVSLIQSNFGVPGHLEVIARVGDRLLHFWRDSGPEFKWNGPDLIAHGVSGNPALIQGRFGIRGNFELVVPLASGGIAHYWRNNDDPQLPWTRSAVFATDVGHVDAVALIQSNFGQPGQLEVVARAGDDLMHFWRDSGSPGVWHGPSTFFTGATGMPGFIQSRFGIKGNFDVVTPVNAGGMVHLWRDNDAAVPAQWTVAESFGSGKVTAVSLLQSNFTTSTNSAQPGPGDFEVAARIDNSTALYWRRDESPYTWNGPTAHACS